MTRPHACDKLREAAREVIEAIVSRDFDLICKAGQKLNAALEATPGRPAKVTDEALAALDHLSVSDAAKVLEITPDAVRKRRKKPKGTS